MVTLGEVVRFFSNTEITVNAKELDPKYGCVFTHWSINGIEQEVR